MKDDDVFWKLEALSDRELLEQLGSMLCSSRRLTAALIAHLGEVEERRLHLAAACSSMFAYCLKLGMTEDEAYRRIEVARLARRFPAIFPLLATGQLTISVVALLKHYVSDENHAELLAVVAGKSVGRTRELIAARFPRPDVASSVRKLPERRMQQPLAIATPTAPWTVAAAPCTDVTKPRFAPNVMGSMELSGRSREADLATSTGGPAELEAAPGLATPPPATGSRLTATPPRSSHIEPLSAERYKVQLTASAELAKKIELARDLMRHSHPGGELGPIVERALDLLIESLMQQRFGKRKNASPQRTNVRAGHAAPEREDAVMTDRSTVRGSAERDTSTPGTTPETAKVTGEHHRELTRASASSHIPRSTRRQVVERDGLGCSWVDEDGVRCGSGAWLEYDHCHPRAKGGGSGPDNLRLLCRNHNRFAAEQEYGRKHVERTIAARRREPHAI